MGYITEITAKTVIFGFLIFISIRDICFHKIDNFVHPIIMIFSFYAFDIPFTERIIGAAVGFLPFLIVSIATNKMGMGDAKLMMAFGFAVGTNCVIAAIIGLFIMVCTAGIYQAVKKTNLPVPLAPFLCIGFVITYYLGKTF